MTWRIYFHKRNGNDPVVWSVDQGTQETEMHVQWYRLDKVHAFSATNLEAKAGEPSGWIQIDYAKATFRDGGVVFSINQGED